ncbi:hypothetical protein [Cohnella sp. WQ 127256]|uniref:hypothetical protein n=1 Tax=Cohnella sp. WQ 127256 TaxID=2938790 RepID=UPI002119068E|nr:hypothetical protein [Cohnella sp. WQ 127256]
MGTMTLKRFNGTEKFKLSESRAYVVRSDDETIMMWFETETDPQAIMSVEDTAVFEMNPNAEVTVYLDKLVLKEFGTRLFELSQGYNEKSRALDASLYYFEHEAVDENIIKIVYKGNGIFFLQWSGTTTDISYYDNSKPKTILEIEGEFSLEEYTSWE